MDLDLTPEPVGGVSVQVRLSRRNLRALLAKLDGHPPNSECRIERAVRENGLVVIAQEDDDHYADRLIVGPGPGVMHPDTEERIHDRSWPEED